MSIQMRIVMVCLIVWSFASEAVFAAGSDVFTFQNSSNPSSASLKRFLETPQGETSYDDSSRPVAWLSTAGSKITVEYDESGRVAAIRLAPNVRDGLVPKEWTSADQYIQIVPDYTANAKYPDLTVTGNTHVQQYSHDGTKYKKTSSLRKYYSPDDDESFWLFYDEYDGLIHGDMMNPGYYPLQVNEGWWRAFLRDLFGCQNPNDCSTNAVTITQCLACCANGSGGPYCAALLQSACDASCYYVFIQ